LAFLKKQPKLLRKLTMTYTRLTARKDWWSILENVGNAFDLDELNIRVQGTCHDCVQLVNAKRPLITGTIKSRVEQRIWCLNCATGTRDHSDTESEAELEWDLDLESFAEEGDGDD
jgi:hypothetical protein